LPKVALLSPCTDAHLGLRLSAQVRLLGEAGCPRVGFAGASLEAQVREEEWGLAQAASWENGGWPVLWVPDRPGQETEAAAMAAGRALLGSPDPAGLLWEAQREHWRLRPPLRAGQGVALIGGSGCGKSTLAQELGERLGLSIQDLDATVALRAGKAIARIFAEDGEPTFRALETEVTCQAFQTPGVLALGGGAWESPAIRNAAQASGFAVLWIAENPGRVWQRVAQDPCRPLAQARETFLARWRARTPQWLEAPRVLPLGRSPGQLAEALQEAMGNRM